MTSVTAILDIGKNYMDADSLETALSDANNRLASLLSDDGASVTAKHLLRSGAYRIMLNQPMTSWPKWKSGIQAPVYCDCRSLLGYPKARRVIAQELARAINESFDGCDLILGIATGGIGWAALVADLLSLPCAYIRTTPKTHGTGSMVEGWRGPTANAVLVDDLVASGGSLRHSIDKSLANTGISVIGIQSVVNWGFDEMRAALEGIHIKCLTSYPDIIRQAHRALMISSSQAEMLLKFYRNPHEYRWI